MMLQDKVALVTGAGQGIGRGIALALAKEGCAVAVSDLDYEKALKVVLEIEALGIKAIAIKCDVSQKAEVESLITETVKGLGKLDILVNNAGVYPYQPFMEMTEEAWDKVMAINLKSVFLTTQAAARQMTAGGKVVNISSIAAFVGFETLTHYCASKGGLNAFIRPLALELAPHKINVNNVAPGAIDTPGATGGQSEDIKDKTAAGIPWGRMGQPADIANAVVFLASDRADYITGQTLIVDGGYTLR
jgi:NAD(P)-dependent dehydrogenase (short-subunit alcohol dehydrogenase family)